jgi:hypothetical protein
MKTIFLMLALGLVGCAGSSGGGPGGDSGSTAAGLDLSGTYNLSGVKCYNAALSGITSNGLYSNAFFRQVVIAANHLTLKERSGTCTATLIGSISFGPSLASQTDLTLLSLTDTGCSVEARAPAGLTPASIIRTYFQDPLATSDKVLGYTAKPYYNGAELRLQNGYSTGTPTDVCFDVYIKQ